MFNAKKLIEKARRRRMSLNHNGINSEGCTTSVAEKGHFVVYTTEGNRFMVPLSYLDNDIFRVLLNMSEDKFGLRGDRPLTLPCDAIFMEYVMSLLRRRDSKDVVQPFCSSLCNNQCSSSSPSLIGHSYQFMVSSF